MTYTGTYGTMVRPRSTAAVRAITSCSRAAPSPRRSRSLRHQPRHPADPIARDHVAGRPLGTYTRMGKTMARADLILTLIKASRQGDEVQVRKAVEALAADERTKNHTILADRLLAQLQSGNGRHVRQTPLLSRSAAGPLVAETVPARTLSDLILSAEAAETVRELVAEQHRADLLRSYSLVPRNRVLLASKTIVECRLRQWKRRFTLNQNNDRAETGSHGRHRLSAPGFARSGNGRPSKADE